MVCYECDRTPLNQHLRGIRIWAYVLRGCQVTPKGQDLTEEKTQSISPSPTTDSIGKNLQAGKIFLDLSHTNRYLRIEVFPAHVVNKMKREEDIRNKDD